MRKLLCLAAFVAVAVSGAGVRPARAAAKTPKPVRVTVMTQNLYLGADLEPVITALIADPSATPAVVGTLWTRVQQTNFAVRAKALAAEIAAAKPDIVALQEAVKWRSQSPSDVVTGNLLPNAKRVEQDFVKMLLKELRKAHRSYRKVASTTGIDVEAPRATGTGVPDDLRLTDRDVVLVRAGVTARNIISANFQASLPLPILGGISVPRSYVSADLKFRRRTIRVVATHLESDSEPVRAAQAQELIAGPVQTTLPLVVLGDFNADANLVVPESTYTTLVGGGLTDAWPALHPGVPGLTWGQAGLLDNTTSTATQRLDLVFSRNGLVPQTADVVGDEPADILGGLWPSDHAGVVVSFELP